MAKLLRQDLVEADARHVAALPGDSQTSVSRVNSSGRTLPPMPADDSRTSDARARLPGHIAALSPDATGGRRLRIVIAMSGGVDSSVAGALLARAGHEVIGITLQLYDHGAATARKGSCCAGQDIHDARRVAEALAIPHYVLDYERRFAAAVIEPFAQSYLAGETPVPCVACNSQIKFRDLLDAARDLGADVLATGHYVQRVDGPTGPELRRGRDSARDQSYFLFSTTREQLASLWFPLGGMTKPEARILARELALPVADKADSQDICFVPSGRYGDVIARLRPGAVEAGDIVHVDGRVLGRHAGIVHYTVGQRRGLGIAGGEPLYVVRVDAGSNRVIVGPRACLATERLELRGVNWLGDVPLPGRSGEGMAVHVRVRSTQPPQPALLWAGSEAGRAEVGLAAAEYGIAAGQACVVYADADPEARVLGGGWIARAIGSAIPEAAGSFSDKGLAMSPLVT